MRDGFEKVCELRFCANVSPISGEEEDKGGRYELLQGPSARVPLARGKNFTAA